MSGRAIQVSGRRTEYGHTLIYSTDVARQVLRVSAIQDNEAKFLRCGTSMANWGKCHAHAPGSRRPGHWCSNVRAAASFAIVRLKLDPRPQGQTRQHQNLPASMFKLLPKGSDLFSHKNFNCYVVARFCATIGVQMQSLALGWQVYALTGNPLDLGLIGLAQFLPFSVLVLVAGQLADHADRRLILFLCYALETLCGILMLYFTLTGLHSLWPVFAVSALYGGVRAFMMPAGQALLPNLVPPASFAKAVAVNSSCWQMASLTGPTLGGLLYLVDPEAVYFTVSCLSLTAMILLACIRLETRQEHKTAPSWHAFLEGLRFVCRKPVVLGAISLDLFAVLFGGATAMLPALASDVLKVGPVELGLLRTATGLGAAITGIVLAFYPISRHVGRSMFDGVILFGVGTILLGLSENFYLSLAALVLMGVGDMVSVFIRQILVQLETPDTIRGRVSAVNAVFVGASNEFGEFESGMAAALLGLAPSIVVGGIATLLVASIWMRSFPALRTMDHFPNASRDA